MLTSRTKLVAFNHASNLTGTINDVKTVVERAHGVGAMVYVDSVQYAPHGVIDVQDLGCDFLVCSPYKFFGPHMGVLLGREDRLRELDPYKVRPAGSEPPDSFETGTLSHEGMAGITATVEYFANIGRSQTDDFRRDRYAHFNTRRQLLCAAMSALTDYETPLTRSLIAGLRALSGVKIHGITNPNAMNLRVPTVSFTADGHHPRTIAQALGDQGIQVWDGHNYAVEPVEHLGLMEAGGVVRVGLAHYNTMEEVDRVVTAIAAHIKA